MSHFARRTLSLLLAITMVAGMLPMGAFAAEAENPEQPTPVVETVTPESSEPAPSESENPAESSAPAPSESETPAESGDPAPSESETPAESSEPTASEPETEETTLPTETQEDTQKGRGVTGENEPYLTAYDVTYHMDIDRWVEDSDEMVGFGFAAGADSYKIFYYNTYDAGTETWTSVPVVPAPGPYLTVTSLNDLENVDTTGDNADYYVRLSAVDTLDAQDTYVEFESATMDVSIVKMTTGFFTSETPSWETYIKGNPQLDASKGENVIYWAYRGDDVPTNVTLSANCNASDKLKMYFGEETDTTPVTIEQINDKVYKLTVNPKIVTLSKYDEEVRITGIVNYTAQEVNDVTSDCQCPIAFFSHENVLPRANIEINDRSYYFYNDGTVWYSYWGEDGYVIVPVSAEGFAYTPDEAIKLTGVHYDYASNTLTLENATLDALRLYSRGTWVADGQEHPDKRLPNDDLTLKLVGNNTINVELQIGMNANVTLAGEGTLTMKGYVDVITTGTLDMATNNKPILLDTGSFVYENSDATILGDFQYVEGYTELRVTYLSGDSETGYYISPETESVSSAEDAPLAEQEHRCVFYLYTWTDGKWESKPVIPEPDGNWTITPIPQEDIQPGATDSGYYVNLRSQGTIDWMYATVSCDGVSYKLNVGPLHFGFYTESEASVESLTPRQDIYTLSASGDNTIYLVTNGSWTVKSITWTLGREDLQDSDLYTVTEIKNGVYQVTFQEACKSYNDLVLYYDIEYGYANSTGTATWGMSLALEPPADTGEEGDAPLILYALWEEPLKDANGNPILDEDGNELYGPVLHGPYTLEEYCLTGMHTQTLLFYNKVMGENGWKMTPVVPKSSDLEFTAYQGSFQHKDIGYVCNVTSNTLGNHPVTLTVGDKTYDWYVAPTPVGYFSAPVATEENYLKGDSQYFFDTTVGGENTFYFIALAGNCGYTMNGGISWDFNTWGQDYADFMGLNSNEDLVTITQLADDAKGNKVWEITVSDAFVDYVKYSYNWKNFCLLISANWTYSDGNSGGIDGHGMFINPPLEQVSPKAAFCIDYAEYFIYEDDAIFCRDWNNGGNFVKITEEDYPEGVSYNVDTNTMTLNNAHLGMLYLEYDNSWYDEDGTFHESHMLPTDTVTLNLVGENTLENDYANGIQLAGGANLEITGSGSLDIHVTNDFEQVPEEYGGGVVRYSPVFLSGTSSLTIGGNAAVTLVSDYATETLGEWLFGIDSEGGTSSLTLKDNATLDIRMPDGEMFKYNEDGSYGFLPIQTNPDSNSGLCAITIRDNAILTTDSMNLSNCVYTQTGGTWNLYTNPTNAEGRGHDGLYAENATLNISGGALNINGRYAEVEGLEDYTFIGIQLAEGSQMNVSGGTVNVHNTFSRGFGIYNAPQTGLNITGGTINLLSEKPDVAYFRALAGVYDPGTIQLQVHGGIINADGSIFAVMEMDDGEINLTGMPGSTLPSMMMVQTGSIAGGKINLSNAIFINGMNFSIDGGEIDIRNTESTTGIGEEEWPLVGLSNQMYLPINGGTITIQTANAPAIENYGTFHQMGGTITATSDTDGVANNGRMLLNSGTLELSGERGVNQGFDEELEGEDGGIFVPEFQVGGGTGDHHLTITGGNIGLLAMGGKVQFTGQAQVDITIPEGGTASGEVAGIYLFDGTNGNCPNELTIEGAVNVNIQCLRESGLGLSSASPVSIIGNQAVCPTISIQATGSAVFFRNNQEELDLLTMEGLEFVTADSGRKLNSWSHENRIGNKWNHYLLEGDAYATYVTTRANTTFAEFTICPASDFRHSYRVTEQDGQQLVEVKDWDADDSEYAPGELPEGVAYDLATNTMTLSNKKAIEWLQVAYLVKDEYGNDIPCLPSQDFTIKLKKSCSIYMLSLGGQINATITGSGTLKLMDSASINGELTIAKGVTLVNDVSIAVRGIASTEYSVGGPAKLTVAKGATLTNNGLLVVDGQEGSTVDIQGKFSQGSKGQTWVSWDQRANVNIAKNLQTLICDITTEEELTAILAEETLSKYKQVRIYASTMTLEEAHTIPKNTSLRVDDGCTLTIGETADVAIAGTLVLDEYGDSCMLQNDGTLRIAKGGTMSMDGNFYGIAPVNEGGKITPQASKLKITAKDNVTSFDLFYMDELTTTLTVAVTTKDTKAPLNRVTWKSSNEKIVKAADIVDNQDGTYQVTFAGGVGKVTLTATTIDGAKKTATVNLTVAYLDGKLTATQEGSYSDKFLQVDETATMAVTVGEESLNDLNAELGTNVVTFKSSNAKVAAVDPETGVITGIKAGTAKITATMAIPGDKRTVSINVKVVAPQILQLQLREGLKNEDKTITSTGELYSYEEGVEGNTTFDLSTFNGKAKDLYIFPEALTWSAEGDSDYEPAVANKLKWTCSDTGIATVKANKDYATVTVKAKAHGVFTITATATDTNKAVATMTFIVMDYKPRLSNPSITLNPKLEGGVKLNLVESYGNTINTVWLEGKNADMLTIDPDTYFVEAVGELKNQTIKPTLVVDTYKGVYEIPLTVTIKNSTPKITVTQYVKLELGYIGGTHIDVTSSIGEVYRVELAEDSSPDILLRAWYYHDDGYHTEYDPETEYNYTEFSLQTSDNCGSPINTKVKLKVYVTGYQVPIDYSFTPKTTTTKITVTTKPTASVINGNAAEYTASFGLKTTVQGETWDLEIWGDEIKDYYDDYHTTDDDVYQYGWKAQVLKVTYNNTELPFEVVDNTIRLTFSKDNYPKGFNGTVKVEIRYPYWSQHKTISHKISTSTKAPTVTPEKSTLTLYSLFPERYAWTTASLNQSNLTLDSIDTPTCTNKEGQKLYMEVYVPGDTGVAYINAYFNQNEDGSYIIPKDGTYTFNTVAHYTDPVTEATKDVKFSFKVKVTSTSPTVKLSSNTIKLNTALAGKEEEGKLSQEEGYVYAKITYNDAWTLSNNGYLDLVGYEVDGHKVFFQQESYDEYGEPVETESTTYEDEEHGIRFRAQRYHQDALYNEGCNGVLFAELTRKTATKHTYTVYPIVHEYTTDTEYTLYKNKLSLTVQPHSGKLSVTQSTSGKLDLLTPENPVIYTIKKVNNAYCDDLQVTLLKKDGKDYVPYETDEYGNYTEAPLFDLYLGGITQSGKNYQAVYLFLNWNYAYTAGKTEQFKLRYTIGDVSFDSPVLSLKINRSTPTITAPTVNYYQAEGSTDKTVQLNLTKPAGATIGRVELNEKKTSKELLAAVEEINPEYDWNWENDTLTIRIVNPSALKAGKTYYLYLDVYPATPRQTSEKPATVKVTVKVAK